MTALQVSIGTLNDLVDAPRDAGHKPGKPIPAGLVTPGIARAVMVIARHAGAPAGRPVRPGDPRLWPVVILAIGYGYDLVAKGTAWSWLPFAVGIPLLPVFGWLGVDRHAAACLRRPRPGGRGRRSRAGHRQRQRGQRARRGRRRRFRGGPPRPAPGLAGEQRVAPGRHRRRDRHPRGGRRRRARHRGRHGCRARHRSRHRRRARRGTCPGASARGSSKRSVSGFSPWPGWRGSPWRARSRDPRCGPARSRSRAGAWRSSGTSPGWPGRSHRSRRGPRRCPGPRPARRRRRPGSAWR